MSAWVSGIRRVGKIQSMICFWFPNLTMWKGSLSKTGILFYFFFCSLPCFRSLELGGTQWALNEYLPSEQMGLFVACQRSCQIGCFKSIFKLASFVQTFGQFAGSVSVPVCCSMNSLVNYGVISQSCWGPGSVIWDLP